MPYRVLIVDDSAFFQTRLKDIINEHPELEVVGIAGNGQEAIEKDKTLKPDVISMDYEMPMVDGITAVKAILAERSVPIVMFSSMTYEGARITLEALDAGAVDFIPKNFAEVSKNSAILKKRLHDRLITFAKNAKPGKVSLNLRKSSGTISVKSRSAIRKEAKPDNSPPARQRVSTGSQPLTAGADTPKFEPARALQRRSRLTKGKAKLLVIGASTGGPVAVTQIISRLPAKFPVPVLIVQHMPENFTRAFAERLDRQSALSVKEAETGDQLGPGKVFVAPGGKQLIIEKNKSTIKIIDGDDRVNYKPCVDISFASAAQLFGDTVHSIVLTGMGSDGCEGAKLLKQKGASVWVQNEETCVVYGMPAAIANAELADAILPIDEFSTKLINEI